MGIEIIIGAVVAALVQAVKRLTKSDELKTYIILLVCALVGGALLFWLETYGYLESAIRAGVWASGIWALIIRQFEKKGIV